MLQGVDTPFSTVFEHVKNELPTLQEASIKPLATPAIVYLTG
jgi:hypothetical protein